MRAFDRFFEVWDLKFYFFFCISRSSLSESESGSLSEIRDFTDSKNFALEKSLLIRSSPYMSAAPRKMRFFLFFLENLLSSFWRILAFRFSCITIYSKEFTLSSLLYGSEQAFSTGFISCGCCIEILEASTFSASKIDFSSFFFFLNGISTFLKPNCVSEMGDVSITSRMLFSFCESLSS